MEIFSVQDLIDALMKVEDKSLPVYGYNGDIMGVIDVDTTITDRVDLNLLCDD